VRPSLTVGYLPTPSSQFGLSDLQTSFFLTPESASEWIWGIGPILQAPTASSTDLGSGKWAAGPTGGFTFNHGPWFNGILADQQMSFAGAHHRGSINRTYLEPYVSYSLDSGWSGQIDPPITYNWTTEKRDAWTLPIGGRRRQRRPACRRAIGPPGRSVRFRKASAGRTRPDGPRPGDAAFPYHPVTLRHLS
jgi:hypothetical protein